MVLAGTEMGGKLYRSEDGGLSWTGVYTLTSGSTFLYHGFKRIVFSTDDPMIAYAGTCVYHNDLNKKFSHTKLWYFQIRQRWSLLDFSQ